MKKKSVKTMWIVILIILLLLIAIVGIMSLTGNTVYTTGASYGKIASEYNQYSDCSYVSEDTGWEVDEQATISYYDVGGDGPKYLSDYCEDSRTVRKYLCDGASGLVRSRAVVCPTYKTCVDGVCM